MILAPIVLFTYNRPEHTKETIKALQANQLAPESDLFIYSDAAKNPEAIGAVQAVRDFLKTVSGFKSVVIVEREHNWGLADSIVDGVTKIVNEYGKVIVLEDDIVTSPYFLTYMNDALDLYQNEESVMHVSGYFYPIDTTDLPDTFFYNQTSCWGWGTWQRAWQKIDLNVDYLLERLSCLENKNYYFKSCISQLRANKRGDIKTWGAKWQASVLLNDGFCLHPSISYVINIGHDGSGIHSTINSVSVNSKITQLSNVSITPNQIIEHPAATERANQFYKTLVPSKLTLVMKTFIRKVKSLKN